MTTSIPYVPEGYHSLTPFIVCTHAAQAIEFYQNVFGAEILDRHAAPDGKILHAEIRIGDSILQLSDPSPEFGLVAPNADGSSSASLVLYCADVDAVFARAVEAGATVREPVQDFVTGDRYGSITDPYGRRWAIMTRIENISREQASRRVQDWIDASFGGKAE